MHSLRLFGGFALLDASGRQVARLSQRRGEAALALLAVAGELGCSRDRLAAMLWPESSQSMARHSLRDVLYGLRQAVDRELTLSIGDRVTLNASVLSTDVGRFAVARVAGRLPEAVQQYHGPFLDGFHVDEAPDFERWCEDERARLFRECAEMLESLAKAAERSADWPAAAAWWQRAADHDPHNSRFVLRLMHALAAAGDRANAIMRAEAHRRRLWHELEIVPDTEFELALAKLRSENGAKHGSARGPLAPPTSIAQTPPTPPPAPHNEATEASDAIPPAMSAAPSRAYRRLRTAAIGLAIVGAALAWPLWWWAHRQPPAFDHDAIAVVPFTWGGHERLIAAAREYHEEIVRELSDGLTPRPVEATQVLAAWRAARGDDATRDPRDVDVAVAVRTGASLVLRGSVDSAATGLTLMLTLTRMPGRKVVTQRTAVLGKDTLWTARRLLLAVLAVEAGEPEHRLGELARHASRPVRIYLANMRRRGRQALQNRVATLREVWALDSTLVYPGLFCFVPFGFGTVDASEDSIARAVWRRRHLLVPEDVAFANAAVGPWFGLADNAEQRIALWRAAASAAPRWWFPSALYAMEYANYGSRTTLKDRRGFESAMMTALEATGWSVGGLVEMAFWHGIFVGDSTLARRAVDARPNAWSRPADSQSPAGSHPNHLFYWFSGPAVWPLLYDAAFGSGAEARRIAPDTLGQRINNVFRSFRVLALGRPRAADVADSIAMRWARLTAGRPPDMLDGWFGWHWRTRGDYAQWLQMARRDYLSGWAKRFDNFDETSADALTVVRDALYLGAPEDTVVRQAVARIQRVAENDSSPAPSLQTQGVAHCWLAQWRMAHGDTIGVGRAITILRRLDAEDRAGRLDGIAGSGRWVVCPALLEAQRAQFVGHRALEKARALDRLLRPMPTPRRSWWKVGAYVTHDNISPFTNNYLAAQFLAAAGDTAAALAAVRRKIALAAFQLDFFDMAPDHLRLEGRFAAAMADTLGAIAAYEEYLLLRSRRPSHPPWAAEWDSVQAELARLKPQR